MNKNTEVLNKNDKISNAVRRREEWVERFNNSLPQQKWYSEEFEDEFSIAIGGIYDSEYMEYVYSNNDIYGRIKKLKKIWYSISRRLNSKKILTLTQSTELQKLNEEVEVEKQIDDYIEMVAETNNFSK